MPPRKHGRYRRVLQVVILTVFPLVALVALVPGNHKIVLVSYFYLLLTVHSMPFACSLIDLFSDVALAHGSGDNLVSNPIVTLEILGSALIIVTVGNWVALCGLAFTILLPIAGGTVSSGGRGIYHA